MRELHLPHTEVVMALERNGLDVDRAMHDVYQKKINSTSLYDYMWGKLEGGGIRQKQNDRIVQMITEKLYRDDVSSLYCASRHLYYFVVSSTTSYGRIQITCS